MNIAAPPGITVDDYPAATRSLRIAFVSETYPPEVNGVALTMARVVEGLHRRNHDVQLVRPRQEAREAAEQGVRFHEVLMRGLPIPRYPHLRMGAPSKRALVKLWSLRRPDVVHIATEGPLGWSALQAALHLRLPVCSDFRTNFHAYSRHYGVGWLRKPIMAYLRKFHNQTQCTMVPTEGLRRDLADAGFRHLTVVARGVDTALFHPARRSEALRTTWGADPDDLVIVHVGRMAPEKNLDTLLAGYARLREQHPRVRLVLVGDGPLRAELQVQWPDVVFAGQRSGEDLAAHFASADLFLFPSLTETFGNVVTEALASGLPVVAYDYAAAAQLIRDGENGRLVPFGDRDAFLRTAEALSGAPVLRQRMSKAAVQTAAGWSWDGIVEHFERALRGVIDAGAGPTPVPDAERRPPRIGLTAKVKRPAG